MELYNRKLVAVQYTSAKFAAHRANTTQEFFMELAILVYLASIIGGFKILAATVLYTSAVAGTLYLVITYVENKPRIGLKIPAIIMSLTAALLIILPSERVMYTMAGAYAAQQIVTDPDAKRISNKIISLIEARLDQLSK